MRLQKRFKRDLIQLDIILGHACAEMVAIMLLKPVIKILLIVLNAWKNWGDKMKCKICNGHGLIFKPSCKPKPCRRCKKTGEIVPLKVKLLNQDKGI